MHSFYGEAMGRDHNGEMMGRNYYGEAMGRDYNGETMNGTVMGDNRLEAYPKLAQGADA